MTQPSGKNDVDITLTAKIEKGKANIVKKVLVSVIPKDAVNYSIKINTSKPKFDISPNLYGLFLRILIIQLMEDFIHN